MSRRSLVRLRPTGAAAPLPLCDIGRGGERPPLVYPWRDRVSSAAV